MIRTIHNLSRQSRELLTLLQSSDGSAITMETLVRRLNLTANADPKASVRRAAAEIRSVGFGVTIADDVVVLTWSPLSARPTETAGATQSNW